MKTMYLNMNCTKYCTCSCVYGVILLICNEIPKQQIKFSKGNDIRVVLLLLSQP